MNHFYLFFSFKKIASFVLCWPLSHGLIVGACHRADDSVFGSVVVVVVPWFISFLPSRHDRL
jgi:hypothetical protein